ncbi:MAG: hypothetical protein ABIR24_08960 [Verrucomicrobiota bacterium]
MSRFPQNIIILWRAEFFSPKDFLRRALVISVAFLIAHLAGLREYTSFLNGTMASVELGWKMCAFLGLGYLALYFAFVLVVPILILAASLLAIRQKFFIKKI